MRQLDYRQLDVRQALAELRDRLSPQGDIVSPAGRQRTIDVFGEALAPAQVVERICRDVRQRGLAAALDYSRRIDRADIGPATLRVPSDELVASHAAASPELLATVRHVRANIVAFQSAILHRSVECESPSGARLAQRYVPLERVGICVPGGAAAYPSTVLMTAVPAQAAGVREIAVVAPPTPFGAYNRDLLATCHELGICEVYRIGGAQAVAALAYGVEGLPRVDKIVGPGNLFVALAKKFVYGDVDIDSIAGPSEVVVVADELAAPDYIAADLLAQAEHSPGASILITWSPQVWQQAAAALQRQMVGLSRGDLARESLEQFGALALVADANQAAELANWLAPEHLHLAVGGDDPAVARRLLEKIPHAGAAFLGNYSAVALGDYVAGPSHVLPTGGTARFASGLSANDFLRRHSVIEFTSQAVAAEAPHVQRLALAEGLTAHWASVAVRVSAKDKPAPNENT